MTTQKTINGVQYYSSPQGLLYPSVTSILWATKPLAQKQALFNWRDRLGQAEATRVTAEASTRGIRLHKYCQLVLEGQPTGKITPKALPFWQSIQPALAEIRDVQYTEQLVCHSLYRYGGQLDAFATFQGVTNTLIEFKTATQPRSPERLTEHCLQTIAYAGALQAEFGLCTNQIAILIALPDESAQVVVLKLEAMQTYGQLWLDRLVQYWRRPLSQINIQ